MGVLFAKMVEPPALSDITKFGFPEIFLFTRGNNGSQTDFSFVLLFLHAETITLIETQIQDYASEKQNQHIVILSSKIDIGL